MINMLFKFIQIIIPIAELLSLKYFSSIISKDE